MNVQGLCETANKLVADDKGLRAMDESNPTCNARFAKLGIVQIAETRRAYREMPGNGCSKRSGLSREQHGCARTPTTTRRTSAALKTVVI